MAQQTLGKERFSVSAIAIENEEALAYLKTWKRRVLEHNKNRQSEKKKTKNFEYELPKYPQVVRVVSDGVETKRVFSVLTH